MQTTKLRMVINPRGIWIAAWFPDQPLDGHLFSIEMGATMTNVADYMYRRRLRKSVFVLK
jgi:hypothetical protein